MGGALDSGICKVGKGSVPKEVWERLIEALVVSCPAGLLRAFSTLMAKPSLL